eukprot:CAMPEP_0115665592 /NCGR_PEP_ID=MMETSP0272-20121206/48967_1 /TAXON_ID=71861 /ORGANISM="Scrippsiella trochoidea, Strain CCMP3099" /LENGTH=165 /DNA_ID=CAMNT_0003104039 /DNA_START=78 /DNA_END=571 /DNA_ORIENTATION=+
MWESGAKPLCWAAHASNWHGISGNRLSLAASLDQLQLAPDLERNVIGPEERVKHSTLSHLKWAVVAIRAVEPAIAIEEHGIQTEHCPYSEQRPIRTIADGLVSAARTPTCARGHLPSWPVVDCSQHSANAGRRRSHKRRRRLVMAPCQETRQERHEQTGLCLARR